MNKKERIKEINQELEELTQEEDVMKHLHYKRLSQITTRKQRLTMEREKLGAPSPIKKTKSISPEFRTRLMSVFKTEGVEYR